MPTTGSPRHTGWKRRLTAAFTERLALKGTAILLALVLWFIVSAKEPAEEIIAVRFQPSIDSSLRVVEGAPPIRALVIGSGRELLKLYSSPPTIRRPIAADAPDTLELTLQPQDVDLPPGTDVIVRDVQPRRITLVFASEMTRMLPVRSGLRLQPDSVERQDPSIRFQPDSVRVTGPRRIVAGLSSVRTVPINIRAADSTAILAPLDTAELGRARVRPAAVFTQVVWKPLAPAVPVPALPGAPQPDTAIRPAP